MTQPIERVTIRPMIACLITAVFTGAVVGLAAFHGQTTTQARATGATESLGTLQAANLPCGDGQTPIGYIATLPSTAYASTLSNDGVAYSQLENVGGQSASDQVLFSGSSSIGGETTQTALANNSAVTSLHPVYPVASEADLKSCNLQLSDQPDDQAFLTTAESTLTAAHLLTASEAPTFIAANLSDDPESTGDLILTLDYQGPPTTPPIGAPAGDTFYSTLTYSVIESSNATSIAYGPSPFGH